MNVILIMVAVITNVRIQLEVMSALVTQVMFLMETDMDVHVSAILVQYVTVES